MDADSSAAAVAAIADMGKFDGHLAGQHKSSGLHLWGNQATMNMNNMVLTNVKQSPYFKYELVELKTFHEVVDAIYYKVTHLEPWERGSRRTAGLSGASGGGLQVRGVGAGGIVSSAYCLLFKLFTLRLNRKQLQTLLDHPDSPYIRGLGFMYIRYCLDPKDYWDWFEPYLDDPEEIDVKAGGGCSITIGAMLRQLLTQLDWYSTLFPRIPVPMEKELRAKLQERAASAGPPPPVGADKRGGDASPLDRRSRGGDERKESRTRSPPERSQHKSRHDGGHHRHHVKHQRSRSRSRSRDDSKDHRDRPDRNRDRHHPRHGHHHHHKDHKDARGDKDSRDKREHR